MQKNIIPFCIFLALISIAADKGSISTLKKIQYPPARIADVVDNYHGTNVPDPYRWLENPDSPETREWIAAENKITFQFLESIPAREKIHKRLREVWNYERYGIPYQEKGHYFYSKNNGLQNQNVLYHVNNLTGDPKVLLDPNMLSSDGTVALQDYAISRDAKYMAYALSSAGSDWMEWKVRDVQTAEDLSDHLKWSKFAGAEWTIDGKGFFYGKYDEPKPGQELAGVNYNQKLYYHKLGTPQSEDKIIYQRPDHKEWAFYPKVSEDGQYLIVTVSRDTAPKYLIFYQDLNQKDSKMVELINTFEAEYVFLGNEGPVFWFKTNLNAPMGRVVAIDIRSPQKQNWKVVIPEAADTIQSIGLVNDQFIISYLKDAHSVVKEFDLGGKFLRDIPLPGLGTVSGFLGKKSDTETFYAFTSYTTPTIIYRYDVKQKQIEVYREPKIDFDPKNFETTQIFYKSKDGTKVPMFITHKKGLKPDKNTSTFLYAYGGFNIPETPNFSAMMLVWMEMGGIYAVPNIRGGGEYGEEWHKAGTKNHKQNVFDDFIAAAEWLIANGYTSKSKLAINGASNGGLLVGACLTQRPDLYGAAVPEVGVMDMLRFHKFTIGWAWVSDFGSSDNAEDFKALYAYSPYHNIKKGTSYPPTFITTADHDDRVVPGHSFKFTAALQAAQAGDAPILIRIETKAGHGAGKPVSKIIEQAGDEISFLTAALNMSES